MIVYVIGAGASKPYGAPVTLELLSKAFSRWHVSPVDVPTRPGDFLEVAQKIDSIYRTHLAGSVRDNRFLSAQDTIALRKTNIEELLGIADETDDDQFRRALERVIFTTLEESIDYHRSNAEYDQLIRHVAGSGVKSCVISFNYDVLLDRALASRAQNSNLPWSYGIPFEAGVENFDSYERLSPRVPQVLLLKLHGSLNWYKCKECGAVRLY